MTSIQQTKQVKFGKVDIREHVMSIGDNPCVSIGPPVSLSWEYREEAQETVEEYETLRKGKRRIKLRQLLLNYYKRMEILEAAEVTPKEIKQAQRRVFWDQTKRKLSLYRSYPNLLVYDIRLSFARRKNKRFLKKYHKQKHNK